MTDLSEIAVGQRKLRWGLLGAAEIARKNYKAIYNAGNSVVTAFFVPGDASSFRHVGARRYAAITMADLADRLSSARQRPVLDRTGLSGQFDVALEYASETAPPAALDRALAATPDSAPPLSVALEQQLGLRLRQERNTVEVLVVRNVERPRPDEN